MNWISTKDQLPKDRQRVIVWNRNCNVSCGGEVIHVYAVNFHQGEHRPNGPWRSCDTGFGNNEVPYCWKEGARTWFGQEILFWMPIPDKPEAL